MPQTRKLADAKDVFSLIDLIRGLMEYATSRGVKSFPHFKNRMWHELLYKLQRHPESCDLVDEVIGEFEWDGPYPKCSDLPEAMFGIGFLCSVRPEDQRISLNPGIETEPAVSQHPNAKDAIVGAYDLACKIPKFFER